MTSSFDSQLFVRRGLQNPGSLRTVFITGASGGIGRALVESFLGEDVALVLTANTRYDDLASECKALVAEGACPMIRVFKTDFSDPDILNVFSDLATGVVAVDQGEAEPRFDACVFAAGIDLMARDLREIEFSEKLRLALETDVVAPATLAKDIGKSMLRRASEDSNFRPSILFFGWDGASRGRAGDSGEIYAAVKGAIAGHARSLAQSLAPYVRVNVLSPGWVKTTWGVQAPERVERLAAADSLLDRWATPAEIVATARFLLSDAASFVNGQEICVNGGYSTKRFPGA